MTLPYVYRRGTGGPALLLVHGLGGAKENFLGAFQCPALAHCTLVAFDEPGTGLAKFDPAAGIDVSALADLTQTIADQLLPEPYFQVGASMGGLISLLQARHYGLGRIQGLLNLEGNLCPEDCMFSRRAIPHTFESFRTAEFPRIVSELQSSPLAGNRMIAHNMLLNVDVLAYYIYSFQTVAESDSGCLLEEFIQLTVPRLFIHGDANRSLSYLPQLQMSHVQVKEIPSSGHFMFYDNPVATFEAIAEFVNLHGR